MKKTLLCILVLLIAGWNLMINQHNAEEKTLNDLILSNVEALAQEETQDKFHCFGYGSIDCSDGHKYEIKYFLR